MISSVLPSLRITGFWIGVAAMTFLVTVSNVLVQYAINDWLTWAAFTYPVCFLVTDLTNRALGPKVARAVIYVGFAVGVALSVYFATWRIGLASGTAFLVAQLLDVYIFDRLRRTAWWQAPLASSSIASAVDTALFFGLAFAGTAVPWVTLALGDYAVKLAMALAMLLPFRALMAYTLPRATPESPA
ncbi:MAG: queuosine precursor transporter [Kiloniellales bacterium]